MMDPVQLLRERQVARGSELSSFGCTRKHLAAAADRGEIRRIRPGVYASWTATPDVVTAAAHGGALTCAKALRAQGVWTLDDDLQPHVWLGAGGRSHPHAPCDCVAHYRPGPMRLGIADVEQALVHAFACYGDELFFAAYDRPATRGSSDPQPEPASVRPFRDPPSGCWTSPERTRRAAWSRSCGCDCTSWGSR